METTQNPFSLSIKSFNPYNERPHSSDRIHSSIILSTQATPRPALPQSPSGTYLGSLTDAPSVNLLSAICRLPAYAPAPAPAQRLPLPLRLFPLPIYRNNIPNPIDSSPLRPLPLSPDVLLVAVTAVS